MRGSDCGPARLYLVQEHAHLVIKAVSFGAVVNNVDDAGRSVGCNRGHQVVSTCRVHRRRGGPRDSVIGGERHLHIRSQAPGRGVLNRGVGECNLAIVIDQKGIVKLMNI